MASNTRANTKNIPAPTNIGFQDFGYFLSKNTRKKIGKPKAIIPCIMIEIIVPPLTIGTPFTLNLISDCLFIKKQHLLKKSYHNYLTSLSGKIRQPKGSYWNFELGFKSCVCFLLCTVMMFFVSVGCNSFYTFKYFREMTLIIEV